MATEPQQRLTIAEYLAFERRSEMRHEFLDGEVFAMTGATRKHNLIEGNTFRVIGNQLIQSPCEIYHESMRVRTPTGLFTYPDVVVVCGEPEFDDSHSDTLLNPILIVEVLSPTTARYDRGKKAAEYRAVPSLQEYVLIAQSHVHVEHWRKHGRDEWLMKELQSLDQALELSCIDCHVALRDMYQRVFK